MPSRKIARAPRRNDALHRREAIEEPKIGRQRGSAQGHSKTEGGDGRALESLRAAVGKRGRVEFSEGVASAAERLRLKLGCGDRVHRLRRIRADEGGGLVAEQIVLPAALFPSLGDKAGLKAGIVDLAAAYRIELGVARERVFIGAASPWASEALDLARSAPVLVLDRVAFTRDRRPCEWRIVERDAPANPEPQPARSGKRRQG